MTCRIFPEFWSLISRDIDWFPRHAYQCPKCSNIWYMIVDEPDNLCNHLTVAELRNLLNGVLPEDEAVKFGIHLFNCEECKKRSIKLLETELAYMDIR